MDWSSAIIAGLVATAVMTVLMYLGRAMGMPMDMPRMLGLMFAGPDNPGAVYALGLMVHAMMGVLFAISYALVFDWLDIDPGWLWGGGFGLIHGIIAGVAFGPMPALHPRMGPNSLLPSPGPFGINYGTMVPGGLLLLHLVYGAVVGGVYDAL